MFGRKIEYEVVPESDYTYLEEKKSSGALLGVGIATTASLSTYAVTKIINRTAAPVEAVPIEVVTEPFNALANAPAMAPVFSPGGLSPDAVLQTGVVGGAVADKVANALEPLFEVIMAFSFPIASVIMLGGCFFFMLGKTERAWTTIFHAGLGYIVIQMLPLFLELMREIGKAV